METRKFIKTNIVLIFAALCLSVSYALSQENSVTYTIKTAEALVNQYPNQAEAHFNLGRAYGRVYRYLDAMKAFENGLEIDPNRADVYIALATLASRSNREKDAHNYLSKAIELSPKQPELHFKLGIILLHLNRLDEARKALKDELAISGPDSYIWFYMGESYLLEKNYDQAINYLNKAIAANDDNHLAHYSLAQAYLRSEQPQKAQKHLERFQKLKSTIDQSDEPGYQSSETDWNKRIKAAVHRDAGRFYLKRQMIDQAVEHFQKAVEIDPKEILSRAQLIDIYLRSGHNIKQALDMAQTLVELKPEAQYYNLLSWAHYRNQNLEQAIRASEKSIQLAPTNRRYQQQYQKLLKIKQSHEN